jgi:single-strand DNA-binding protein
MANFNKVILIGNLTRDPEIRYTPSGTAVGDLRMAVNRRFRTGDGQERDETCFVGVTVWGRQAETCGEYLKKGRPLLVEGRLKYDEWEKEGQKFSRLSVVAERVQFLGSPRGAEFKDGGAPMGGSQTSGPESAPPAPGPTGGVGNIEPLAEDDDNLPF